MIRPLCLAFRLGLNIGPVAAGIIGRDKFLYDVWGDTLNVASRMKAMGQPGRVHLKAETLAALGGPFPIEMSRPVSSRTSAAGAQIRDL